MPDRPPVVFIPSPYPGGRILMRCGSVDVGAVFPPAVQGDRWRWITWVTRDHFTREGACRTEGAARNAALAVFRDFLTAAGLERESV